MNTAWDWFSVLATVLIALLVIGAATYGWASFLDDWRSGRFSRKPKDPQEGEIYTSRDMPGHEAEVVRTDDGVVHFRCGRALHCHTVQQFHQFYVKLRDRMTP